MAADTTNHPHDDEPGGPHGAGDHDDDGGHDDHGHGSESLGPIDVVAWTFSAFGVVLGLVVVLALAVAAGVFG
jgi:hypothetical protein